MKKQLLFATIVVFGIVAVIVFASGLIFPALAIWIYLAWMVWKKKTKIFHDRMDPKLAERRYKMLKVFLRVAGIALAVGIVGVIVHNALYAMNEIEEPIFFVIALVGLWVFFIATIGGLVIFLKGRRKTT